MRGMLAPRLGVIYDWTRVARGKLFAIYVAGYGLGRLWRESSDWRT